MDDLRRKLEPLGGVLHPRLSPRVTHLVVPQITLARPVLFAVVHGIKIVTREYFDALHDAFYSPDVVVDRRPPRALFEKDLPDHTRFLPPLGPLVAEVPRSLFLPQGMC